MAASPPAPVSPAASVPAATARRLAEAYAAHQHTVRLIVTTRLRGTPADVADVCQLVFVKFLAALLSGGPVRSPGGLLVVIASRTAASWRRDHGREMPTASERIEFIGGADDSADVRHAADHNERRAALAAAIASLPEDLQVIIQFQLQGRSYAEMAQLLSVSKEVINYKHHQALVRLRRAMVPRPV